MDLDEVQAENRWTDGLPHVPFGSPNLAYQTGPDGGPSAA
jgi:hypothetical protein